MGKKLRISTIIIFSIICLVELAAVFCGTMLLISLFSPDTIGKAFGIAIFLVYLMIATGILLVLNIVQSILCKILSKKMAESETPAPKIDKICKLLPWFFLLLNLIIIVIVYIF